VSAFWDAARNFLRQRPEDNDHASYAFASQIQGQGTDRTQRAISQHGLKVPRLLDTFFVSPMPVHPTAIRRVWRAIGFGLVMLVIWLSLTPHPIEIPVEQGDKLGHIAAYATLMFWFAQLDTRHRMRVAYAIGFVTLGVALEVAQRLTDYRTFEVADMGADAVGVLFGWLVSPPRGPSTIGFVERMLSSS
jgi:VanZ family protein